MSCYKCTSNSALVIFPAGEGGGQVCFSMLKLFECIMKHNFQNSLVLNLTNIKFT